MAASPAAQALERVARDLPPGGAVLDLSAGTGLATSTVAARARLLVATEEYLAVVRQARREAPPDVAPRVAHMLAEPSALPLRSRAMDAVVCLNALHSYRDVGGVLGQVRRVLRPGGPFLSATFCARDSPFHWSGLPPRDMAPPPPKQRFSRKSLEATLAKAGFAVERSETLATDPFVQYVLARPIAGSG